MTRARSIGVTKIALVGVLISMPIAAVSVPAYAAPGFGGVASVIPAPLPADPPTIAPPPPAPPPTHSHYTETEDWWGYGMDAGGGGGGGG